MTECKNVLRFATFFLLISGSFLCVGAGKASAATYYIDATNGKDSNTGIDTDHPWQTIAKVNASTFQPGDSILFKRGETWTGAGINADSHGTTDHPIIYGAYGIGAKPTFIGTKTIASNLWTGPDENGVYSWTSAGDTAHILMQNEVPLRGAAADLKCISHTPPYTLTTTRNLFTSDMVGKYIHIVGLSPWNSGLYLIDSVTDSNNVVLHTDPTNGSNAYSGSDASCLTGNHVWAGNVLYYLPTSGTPANWTLALQRYSGLGAVANIVVDGLSFKDGYVGIGNWHTAGVSYDNIEIKNCSFFNHTSNGIALASNTVDLNNIKIHDNTFDFVTQGIALNEGGCDGMNPGPAYLTNNLNNFSIYNNTMTHCSQIYGGSPGATPQSYDSKAVSHNDVEGLGTQNSVNSNIYGNNISGVCRGITFYACINSTMHDSNLYNNIFNTTRSAIIASGNSGSDVYRNYIHNNVIVSGGIADINSRQAGVVIINTPYASGGYNGFYNNVVYSGGVGSNLWLRGAVGATNYYFDIKNNIFSNPANYHIFDWSGIGQKATNITYDHNLYYPGTTNTFKVGLNYYYDFNGWKGLDGVRDANSPTPADPLFVNASASDFHLQSASPAINAGVDVGLTSDYAGNPIVGALDIGAYEYQGTAVDTTPPAAPTGLDVI